MNYGFVIDNRACIGCHACSTACKSENDVPLGVYRTWVKYVETGSGHDARRHFQVTRCNHCANPPCVRICPVTAMYQRDDGIVEFDGESCIGCKACLQACPYDAIHIDPQTGTAAKCHYCSHRVEIGLEPSCVVVCPTHAIIAGDLDDPASEIRRLLSAEKVTVRRPEQGTAPKLFYIEGTDASLQPLSAPHPPETFLWADVPAGHPGHASRPHPDRRNGRTRLSESGETLRKPQPQGLPDALLPIGGRLAGQMVQVSYNAQHRIPWHWPVPAYLTTKAIGSGLFALLSLSWIFGWLPFDQGLAVGAGLVSLIFTALTTALLVLDLERPERFLRVLLRPQWKSWLTRGAMILLGFSIVAGLWWALETAAAVGWAEPDDLELPRLVLLPIGFVLALGTGVYTAFLFGQAEGRDLWQSPLLPLHMLVQAALMGAAALLLLTVCGLGQPPHLTGARTALGVLILVDLAILLLGELAMPHASQAAAKAAHEIRAGRYQVHFWAGGVGLGHVLPGLLLLLAAAESSGPVPDAASVLAAVACAAGLYLYEYAFVLAPQEIPNS